MHRRLGLLVAVTLLAAASVAAPATAATPIAPTGAPMILQNVSSQDLDANVNGICTAGKAGRFTDIISVVTASSTLTRARNYLATAGRCGYKVWFYFSATVSGSAVYPDRVARWVNAVKGISNLAGYLSVKEPSWVGIGPAKIRSLYRAFKAADPNHPVMALFGDIPHFGDSANPYTAGMANVVMVNWYPVETSSGGCSSTGRVYLTTGPKWFSTKVKPRVAASTPGVPVYVMVQTHKYLGPRCHKKQVPTQALLDRQAREAFRYAGAKGIAFHVWSNGNYQLDERRSPTVFNWMKYLADKVHAGTFR
jgi:hypothetical protein